MPPYKKNKSFESTAAALEFGVCELKIKNIIVIGHSECAGIKNLIDNKNQTEFIDSWTKIALNAKKNAKTNNDLMKKKSSLQTLCELENIKLSLKNLLTYPWIKKEVNQKNVKIIGWYFSLKYGTIKEFDTEKSEFKVI